MQPGKLLSFCLMLVASSPLLAATPQNYFGISFNDTQLETQASGEFDGGSLSAKLGYSINRWLDVEMQLGADSFSDQDDFNQLEVGYIASFMKLKLPYERINVYGLVGLAIVGADFGDSYNDTFSDGAYGFGVELYGTDRTALNIEFSQLGMDDKYKSMGIGFVHRFNWPKFRSER